MCIMGISIVIRCKSSLHHEESYTYIEYDSSKCNNIEVPLRTWVICEILPKVNVLCAMLFCVRKVETGGIVICGLACCMTTSNLSS